MNASCEPRMRLRVLTLQVYLIVTICKINWLTFGTYSLLLLTLTRELLSFAYRTQYQDSLTLTLSQHKTRNVYFRPKHITLRYISVWIISRNKKKQIYIFPAIYDPHCKNVTADLMRHITNRTNVNFDSAFVGIGTIFCGKSKARQKLQEFHHISFHPDVISNINITQGYIFWTKINIMGFVVG